MKVGLTYSFQNANLSHESKAPAAIVSNPRNILNAVERALRALGYDIERIGNIWNLTTRLTAGERWDLVFTIGQGPDSYDLQAQLSSLLDVYEIPYAFSDSRTLALTLHKGTAKMAVRDQGLPTADFCIVQSETDFSKIDLPSPLFAKPVTGRGGTGPALGSKITSKKELFSICDRLLRVYGQPILVEQFLSGPEFTVGIMGTGKESVAIGVVEVLPNNDAIPGSACGWDEEDGQGLVEYCLRTDAFSEYVASVGLDAWIGLGCRDAGCVDLRVDANGIPNFLRVHPLPRLNPESSDLCIIADLVGMNYKRLIESIVSSARDRVTLGRTPHHPATMNGRFAQRLKIRSTTPPGFFSRASCPGGVC